MPPTILVQLADRTDSDPTAGAEVDPLTEYALSRAERDGGVDIERPGRTASAAA